MTLDEQITGVTVTHNTKELIERAYNSIRKLHLNMQVVIIDGSDNEDICRDYIKSISNEKTIPVLAAGNIGHGRGLALGLSYIKTRFALIFDSDIEMIKSPLQLMSAMIEDDTYGIGYIEKAFCGGNKWVRYLHPYFCLIQLKEYKKYSPFIHHGYPAINTMLDIHRRGLGDKVIKDFLGLTRRSEEFIKHTSRGTSGMRQRRGLIDVEGVWDKVM